MSIFEQMREFFHRRAAKNLSVEADRAYLINRRQEPLRGKFVFPGTDYLVDIEVQGRRVGHVDYGVNPLGDRLYINMLEINPTHQRQGLGPGCAVEPVAHIPGANCAALSIHLIRLVLVSGAPTFCSGQSRDKGRVAQRRSKWSWNDNAGSTWCLNPSMNA